MSDRSLVDQIEKKIDAEYAAYFPADVGWENATLHFLLVFDLAAADERFTAQLDALKYPLMHALRWGANVPSQPLTGVPTTADPELLERCETAFWRALDYVGICGAFINFYRGVISISDVTPERIAFTSNAASQAFEILSARLSKQSLNEEGRSAAADIGELAERSLTMQGESEDTTLVSIVDTATLHDLVRRVRAVTSSGYQLPDVWSYDGVGISDLRRFWDSVNVLATFHLARAARREESSHFSNLMVWPRAQWIACVQQCSSLEETVVARLVDLLTYSRQQKIPDIALTPLLDIGGGFLAASPWMVFSSSMERNFCARLARDDTRYNRLTEPLHHEMARQLTSTFERAGFSCRADVPISTELGNTAIDLLVWSPSERVVLAAELKWVIAVADVMEVFNRGDAAARTAIDRQLPRYANALSAGAAELVRRAFELPTMPQVEEWHCGLIMRGHVGSSQTQTPGKFTLPESLVNEHTEKHHSLRAFCKWATEMPFLPKLDRDFLSERFVVRSPSGIEIEFFEPTPTE